MNLCLYYNLLYKRSPPRVLADQHRHEVVQHLLLVTILPRQQVQRAARHHRRDVVHITFHAELIPMFRKALLQTLAAVRVSARRAQDGVLHDTEARHAAVPALTRLLRGDQLLHGAQTFLLHCAQCRHSALVLLMCRHHPGALLLPILELALDARLLAHVRLHLLLGDVELHEQLVLLQPQRRDLFVALLQVHLGCVQLRFVLRRPHRLLLGHVLLRPCELLGVGQGLCQLRNSRRKVRALTLERRPLAGVCRQRLARVAECPHGLVVLVPPGVCLVLRDSQCTLSIPHACRELRVRLLECRVRGCGGVETFAQLRQLRRDLRNARGLLVALASSLGLALGRDLDLVLPLSLPLQHLGLLGGAAVGCVLLHALALGAVVRGLLPQHFKLRLTLLQRCAQRLRRHVLVLELALESRPLLIVRPALDIMRRDCLRQLELLRRKSIGVLLGLALHLCHTVLHVPQLGGL
eukprot:PhM_4_TR479/c0_g1_i2/m.96030